MTELYVISKLCYNEACFKGTVPVRAAQSVTCLTTDACVTADPLVESLILVWSHSFVEIDYPFC